MSDDGTPTRLDAADYEREQHREAPASVPRSVREDEIDETRHVERTDTGVSLTAELKRGTGTRDQDKITAKVKGESFADVREEYEENREWLREQVHDLRTWQPDADGDDE